MEKGSDVEAVARKLRYPVITKPTDNSGSRGIMLVRSSEELKEAIFYSSQNGREGNVIVEEYMVGPEVSVEIMVVDGLTHIIQVTDKLTTGAPHFVEIGHSQPSRLPKDAIASIKELAQNAAQAVGIKMGLPMLRLFLQRMGQRWLK